MSFSLLLVCSVFLSSFSPKSFFFQGKEKKNKEEVTGIVFLLSEQTSPGKTLVTSSGIKHLEFLCMISKWFIGWSISRCLLLSVISRIDFRFHPLTFISLNFLRERKDLESLLFQRNQKNVRLTWSVLKSDTLSAKLLFPEVTPVYVSNGNLLSKNRIICVLILCLNVVAPWTSSSWTNKTIRMSQWNEETS